MVATSPSLGSRTPFYTPAKKLDWKFRQYGIEPVEIGEAGEGTFYVGRMTDLADPRRAV